MNESNKSSLKENILIVDDNPANLNLLNEILSKQGYKVRAALNGKIALKSVQLTRPDLILLDILMPEMDGYQVCQVLKSTPSTTDIPVIFISALNEVFDQVKAFSVGGVDYIPKPFRTEEVLVRIQNQLQIGRLSKQLLKQNIQLQQELLERQRAEDALSQSRQRLQYLLTASPAVIYSAKPNGNYQVTYISENVSKILSYEAREFLANENFWLSHVHPEDRNTLIAERSQRSDRNIYFHEYRFLHADGTYHWLHDEINFIQDETGKNIEIVGYLVDISDRKKAEKELEFQAVITRNMAEGICLIRAVDKKIVYANSKFETLFDYQQSELNGKLISLLIYNDRNISTEEVINQIGREIDRSGAVSCEFHNIKKDGTPFWCQATISQFEHPDYGKVYVAIQHDITEQKQAQEQIKNSLQEKEVLLKEIHHRVKNNLQIVKSLLHIQSKRTKHQEALLVLQDSQNRIASIALVHEKIYRSDDLAKVDFGQYIPSLTNHLFHTYNVNSNNINLHLEIENIILEIDTAIPCGLIINELVSNSLKYAFSNHQKGEIEVKFARKNEEEMMLIVRDNGIGIPDEFDDLETASSSGLKLVQALVNQLNGEIEIARSQGTKFSITFPV